MANEEACFLLTDDSQGFNRIDEIQPGSTLTIDQEFTINDNVEDFVDGDLRLELHLSGPQTRLIQTVQEHRMEVQISCPYQRTENPGYLLVVNSDTPNYAIRQTLGFVRHRLRMEVDVFNLSVYGSYNIRGSGESVLSQYSGKSIIIFCNDYRHPWLGLSRPWDFIDPRAATKLLECGTSLHFSNVAEAALNDLQSWTNTVVFPARGLRADQHTVSIQDSNTLATDLRRSRVSLEVLREFPVAQTPLSAFESLESTLNRRTRTTVKMLAQNLPLRRFIVAPVPTTSGGETPKKGRLLVMEGVPRTAKMTATTVPFQDLPPSSYRQTESVSDHDAFLLVSCLPFNRRVRMFWNMVCHEDAHGIGWDTLFEGLEKGLEEGLEEGLEKGLRRDSRNSLRPRRKLELTNSLS
ncbi:hypothetical protein PG994_013596 [Apiospora phragmitis]|uniref:Uncharacterized protein n=1 Tax=Apiospora phragmitis TaxID=2905665 RepID=A0ABR1TBP0_9PEZI